ncbi:restriction endonuclease subunit S [Janibacter melonis]|uniref:restriction endonuclease subunit S n=1 Tax=Janibacter melonis TaxID=262209 RepID=UPI001E52826A|nr:restriction endonuclease subunit S [Janibacter melonis]MCB5990988.1 restriction endonuclease subunit S [Janibacter melonis]
MTTPAGWERKTLGELGRYLNGRAFKKQEWRSHGRPIIRIQNLTGSSDVFNYFEGEVEDRYVVRPGDLLVSWAATLGSYIWTGPEGVLNQHIFKVQSNIDLKFHKYLLDHKLDELMRHTHGSGMVHITRGRFDAVPVDIPPLDAQRRIVALLEDHLSRLDAAERSMERAHSSAKALVRAALSSGLRGTLVTDDLSEGSAVELLGEAPAFTPQEDERVWPVPETWAWARIGDLFDVNVGATPSRAVAAHWSGDLPWVSSGEVAFGRISSTREHITREAAGNPARRIQPPGTVMLAMIGEGKTRGQAAILDIEAAHNQNCASIRVSATKVLPEYIYGYLEERYLETRRGGSGGQQPALNKAAIQRFPVPIAPLGTQRRLVEAWTEVRDAAGRLEHGILAATLRHSTLRRALLQAAFSGRLTGAASEPSEAEEMITA